MKNVKVKIIQITQNQTKTLIKIYALLLVCLSASFTQAQTPNHCLHFDGNDDVVSILNFPIHIIPAGANFTTELWFYSENDPNCNLLNNSLLVGIDALGQREFEINMCSNDLYFNNTPFAPYSSNTWNHLALVHDVALNEERLYLNGNLVYTLPTVIIPPILQIALGGAIDATTQFWKGKIDEFRVWNVARTDFEISSAMNCPCKGTEDDITICMPFDQGMADDLAPLPIISSNPVFHNGQLIDFALTGSTSNYILSDAPLVYPSFANTDVMISQYFGSTLIPANEICSGDPVHFCIKNLDGSPLNISSPNTLISFQWQYLDNTVAQFTDVPTFINACFGVGPDKITIDCANNPDGYIDRKYRAMIEVEDIASGMLCIYFTEEFDMRICCPLSDAVVNVTTDLTNDLLCVGDIVNFDVSLNTPDFFVNPPGAGITIVWTYNGADISQNNQISFTHNVSSVVGTEACFEATVTNCAGKEMKYKTCLNVDLQPKCGVITENPTGTLMQLSAVPLVYEICPGDDASLEKLNASVFQDGDFVWQYSFPYSLPGVWHDLGTNNNIQNTNILPVINPPGSPYLWPPGETCVVYRIEGRPFNDPSGCDSCHTNELTICLKTPPVNDVIVGSDKFCKGSSTILALANYNSSFQHFWYWNGSYVGNGSSINADEGGCYWVVISNGCESVTTPPHCIEECEIKAVLSCPLAPNMCPNAGDMITLSACDSESNCTDPLSYSFQWSNNPGAGAVNGCQLTHNVMAGGTTYTVTVTDSNGCSNTASITLIPCN
ncbi:MAG: LamG domain-containing protein [Saprospiraceae bacterium]|nr:LamG domain-containing protein [Saprospiraceae bacterium]